MPLLLILLLAGCVTTDYVGRSLPASTAVDVYYDEADVGRPFTVMGEVRAEMNNHAFFHPSEKMQRKLIELAREKGADAIIIGRVLLRANGSTEWHSGETTYKPGRGSTTATTTTVTEEVKELRGLLITYAPAEPAGAGAEAMRR